MPGVWKQNIDQLAKNATQIDNATRVTKQIATVQTKLTLALTALHERILQTKYKIPVTSTEFYLSPQQKCIDITANVFAGIGKLMTDQCTETSKASCMRSKCKLNALHHKSRTVSKNKQGYCMQMTPRPKFTCITNTLKPRRRAA